MLRTALIQRSAADCISQLFYLPSKGIKGLFGQGIKVSEI